MQHKKRLKHIDLFNSHFVKSGAGFTLIELIIVVAIIALLAAAVFVALDPAKRISNATDARRWEDVNAIADAIMHYTVDNDGILPTVISGAGSDTPYVIPITGQTDSTPYPCISVGTSNYYKLDITSPIVPEYLPTMPIDPTITLTTAETSGSGYYFRKDSSGRIKIGACYESRYATASIYVQR